MNRLSQAKKQTDFETPAANTSQIERKWLDLTYSHTSPAQKLDIYLPNEGKGPFPVLFYIHGGGFSGGDKRDLHVLTYLKGLQYGYALVAANYRLSGEAVFPAGLQDIKAAIRWMRANNEKFLLDTGHIAALGGSSGGNFAAMVCLTDRVAYFNDYALGSEDYPCNVHAAVDWFGPIDFLTMDEQLLENGYGPAEHSQEDSPESRYLGARLADVPLMVTLANPMTYIHKDMPPLLIQHGRLDALVPVQQSIEFVNKLAQIVPADRYEFDIIAGAGHSTQSLDTPENMERVFAFLNKYLKN